MKRTKVMVMLATLGIGAGVTATSRAAPTLDQMQWRHRILLVAAADPDDPRAKSQRHIFAEWGGGARDRDVLLVDVAGEHVEGASDTANALRKRYGLAPQDFQVLLIGKDGHVALRSNQPLGAGDLQATIDAMPMRRSGQR